MPLSRLHDRAVRSRTNRLCGIDRLVDRHWRRHHLRVRHDPHESGEDRVSDSERRGTVDDTLPPLAIGHVLAAASVVGVDEDVGVGRRLLVGGLVR
jgi:hypothetical protein